MGRYTSDSESSRSSRHKKSKKSSKRSSSRGRTRLQSPKKCKKKLKKYARSKHSSSRDSKISDRKSRRRRRSKSSSHSPENRWKKSSSRDGEERRRCRGDGGKTSSSRDGEERRRRRGDGGKTSSSRRRQRLRSSSDSDSFSSNSSSSSSSYSSYRSRTPTPKPKFDYDPDELLEKLNKAAVEAMAANRKLKCDPPFSSVEMQIKREDTINELRGGAKSSADSYYGSCSTVTPVAPPAPLLSSKLTDLTSADESPVVVDLNHPLLDTKSLSTTQFSTGFQSLLHPNFLLENQDEKLNRWIKKLYQIRQRTMNGDILSM